MSIRFAVLFPFFLCVEVWAEKLSPIETSAQVLST